VGEVVLEEAARACARHGLRAYDAVQLGAAIAARRADDTIAGFACFERELSEAALAEGFGLAP